MEQRQDQARERQTAQKQDQRTAEHRREPERERLGNAGLTARAVSAGRSLLDLPPEGLEELAAWMGNQGMEELLAAQGPPLEEADFRPPTGEPETEPFPVPEGAPELADSQSLNGPVSGQAFDPAYL